MTDSDGPRHRAAAPQNDRLTPTEDPAGIKQTDNRGEADLPSLPQESGWTP